MMVQLELELQTLAGSFADKGEAPFALRVRTWGALVDMAHAVRILACGKPFV